jgi:hypothetical protein
MQTDGQTCYGRDTLLHETRSLNTPVIKQINVKHSIIQQTTYPLVI